MLTQSIIQLREDAGFSQAQVAKSIGVSRGTYANYEAGDTEPRLSELVSLAELYDTSIDALVDTAGAGDMVLSFAEITKRSSNEKRSPILFNQEKFREVLLYILEKVGGRANIGETALYKLLYFIDTDYYERYGSSITGLSYVKQKYGPTPTQSEFLPAISALKKRGELVTTEVQSGSYRQKKYLPTVESELDILSAHELEHINWELIRLSFLNAKELSALSHQDTPWIAAEMGAPIDYQHVMYRTPATRTRELGDDL
jgi:transcriptional regulator with XRE-family HTH domain